MSGFLEEYDPIPDAFNEKKKRDNEGRPICKLLPVDGRKSILNLKKRIASYINSWATREETEPTLELLQFKHDTLRFVRDLEST